MSTPHLGLERRLLQLSYALSGEHGANLHESMAPKLAIPLARHQQGVDSELICGVGVCECLLEAKSELSKTLVEVAVARGSPIHVIFSAQNPC